MTKRNFRNLQIFGISILNPINILIILNVIVQIIQYSLRYGGDPRFENYIYTLFALIPRFAWGESYYWQFLTYGFMHSPSGFPLHLAMNMYGLFLFGRFLLQSMGIFHFLGLYFVSLLGGSITVVGSAYAKFLLNENISVMMTPTLGASGAIFGLILVFGVLFPSFEFQLLFIPVPIRAEYLVLVSVVMGLIFTYVFNVPISNEGHIGGAVFGGIYYLLFLRKLPVT
jgi:membrane associated rhomboid family serine protease